MKLGSSGLSTRMVAINLFFFAVMLVLQVAGAISAVFGQGTSGLIVCAIITVVFVHSLYLTFAYARNIDREFDRLHAGESDLLARYIEQSNVDSGSAKSQLEERLFGALSRIDYNTELMPNLGMFGTIMGLIMAIDLSAFSEVKDLNDVMQQIVFQLFAGLGVAFYTTIVGLVFARWNRHNSQELEEALAQLSMEICDQGLAARGQISAPSSPSSGVKKTGGE